MNKTGGEEYNSPHHSGQSGYGSSDRPECEYPSAISIEQAMSLKSYLKSTMTKSSGTLKSLDLEILPFSLLRSGS